jgi:TolB-like protein/Tfp pilus assembly protein PilF
MFTDMIGYTALGQKNESLSLALVDEQRKLIRSILARHNGREIKTIGDAFLVEFPNALDAVRCAYEIQRATREYSISLPPESRIHLRIGLHLGDVVESQGDISGDAVNMASRIYPLAEDGGVCLTRQVYDQVSNKTELQITSVGVKSLKNVSLPIEVYKIEMPWQQSTTAEMPTYAANRVAILPFRSMSPDPNDEYFAEGMTEEIISTVSGISGLKIISRTSVMGYKGTTKKVKEIGRELEVGSVLEGSFRKAGNRIRVTTQLISVADDEHLWAQSYDRNLDDVFEVQCDVAKQVAEALRVKILDPERERLEKKPTESTVAYTLHLKGRYLWNKRAGKQGVDDLKKARECFEQAINEDSTFALGYAGVADCCLMLRNDWGVDSDANLERAKVMVAKALELDPGLAEARTTKGMILFNENNLRDAENEFRKAIELKPSYTTAHQWFMWVLGTQKRWDEAIEQIDKAIELDPLSPLVNGNYGYLRVWRRDYPGAIEPLRRALELGDVGAHGDLGLVYGKMKRFEEMKREYETWVDLLRDSLPMARAIADANMAYLEDDKERVRQLLPVLESHYREPGISSVLLADLRFYLAENDKGFEWLERSYAMNVGCAFIVIDENLDGVRTDPRYLDLLKRLGLD